MITVSVTPLFLSCSLPFLSLSRVPRLQFEYTAPTPGFDHSRVKGPVAKLIRLKDPAAATALEVAAGGRVRNGNKKHHSDFS